MAIVRIIIGCIYIIVGVLFAAGSVESGPYASWSGWRGVVVGVAAGVLAVIIGVYALTRKPRRVGEVERDALAILVGWAFIIVGIVFVACALIPNPHAHGGGLVPNAILTAVGVIGTVIGVRHTRKLRARV